MKRATHFSPFRRGKTSAIRHAPQRGSVQHTRSPPRNKRAQQQQREMKPGSWQLSQEPWSLSVAPRTVPQLADGGTNLRHDRAQRADGTCTRVRLVMWRLLTGKPDAPRGGFNRSIDATYKTDEGERAQMLTRTTTSPRGEVHTAPRRARRSWCSDETLPARSAHRSKQPPPRSG